MYLVQASWWAPEDRLLQKTSTLLQRESWSRICLASWSGIAGLVPHLTEVLRHQYINTSWSGIAACGMVFSMRQTGTAVTGDLDLPKII